MIKKYLKKPNQVVELYLAKLCAFVAIAVLFGTINVQAQASMLSVANATDTLIVYQNVPTVNPSDKYTIQVKSALTNGKWVNVFAHSVKNLFSQLGDDGNADKRLNYHYVADTDGWSHAYGNIEMSRNTAVEVEIALKPGVLINKTAIVKAAAYPAHRVMKQPTIVNGKIYFTIYNPGQITIDINGQMDDYHFVSKPMGAPVHAITFFANPVMAKPSLTDPNVLVVEPGQKPQANFGKTIMYFKPGFHDLGVNFKIFAGKKYYIPGDAVVSATLNNIGNAGTAGLQLGENIKVYGYGTINSTKIPHPYYVPDGKGGYIPENQIDHQEYSPIALYDCVNAEINGITFSDVNYHTAKLYAYRNATKIPSTCRWVKIIGWRSNGDGLGRIELIENSFIRTQDDASYLKGDRIRVVFWRDNHAAGFHMAGAFTQPCLIDDCDVIYHRDRDGSKGAIFHSRGIGGGEILNLNLTVRNFRSSDKLANAPFFGMAAGGTSFKGITFQNISIASNTTKQVLMGNSVTPYNGGITFDNVTVKGELVTQASFPAIFTTNAFVSGLTYKNTSQPVTLAVYGGKGGAVSGGASVNNNKAITVVATAAKGYVFEYWKEGDIVVSIDANYTFDVMKARKLDAYFTLGTSSASNVVDDLFSIYPNPVSDLLYFDFKGQNENSEIKIFNGLGQEVYRAMVSGSNAKVDVKSLGLKGVVVAQVVSGNSVSSQKILVK